MVHQNRKRIWKKLKTNLCSSSANNQVAPADAPPVIHDDHSIAIGTSEILTLVTISTYVINSVLLSLQFSSVEKTAVIVRNMLSLLIMAITHIIWITVSQKIRQFTMEWITTIKNWCTI